MKKILLVIALMLIGTTFALAQEVDPDSAVRVGNEEEMVVGEPATPTPAPLVAVFPAAAEIKLPRVVYQEYLNALNEEKWPKIKKCLSQAWGNRVEARSESEEALARTVKMIKSQEARDVRIITEDIKDEEAILTMEGKMPDGPAKGTVTFVKEEGGWRIAKESWKGPESKTSSSTVKSSSSVDTKYKTNGPLTSSDQRK